MRGSQGKSQIKTRNWRYGMFKEISFDLYFVIVVFLAVEDSRVKNAMFLKPLPEPLTVTVYLGIWILSLK